MVRPLILFDIDGTLIVDDAYAHGRAMVRAMRDVYGVEVSEDAVERTSPWGKTDRRIAREALRAAGTADEAIDDRFTEWMTVAAEIFGREAESSAGDWSVRPGLRPALKRLTDAGAWLALLTGNLRAIAATKVAHIGLSAQFDLSVGAYGDDAEERTALVPIARQRAGTEGGRPWPRQHTVVVGDTPGDLQAARADAVACILFASQRFPRQCLSGAEAVVSSVGELVSAIEGRQDPRPDGR